ncbi:MAG: chorismate-binding protein [Actinomycetaceae bacterium]|nr:chorismate-binding protein [Arcanobacterium sp.]MDD7504346.1 chorismate-binding protein [Actinomycetaceae bacterium]MDY6143010.1 chorismate-binding protein [Arcanobacterium sp.]
MFPQLDLSFEQFNTLADEGYSRVPVSGAILSDTSTPITVLRALQTRSRHCYLLESAEQSDSWGRYTFLGFDPQEEISAMDGTVTHRILRGERVVSESVVSDSNPRDIVARILAENTSPQMPELPPFTGGLVGYFGYDYLKYTEPHLNLNAEDAEGFKDLDLMLFDKVIAFDNYRQKIIVIVNACIRPDTDRLQVYGEARSQVETIITLIRSGEQVELEPGRVTSEFRTLFDEERFSSMVRAAKKYIYEGDIFQVVLSNRLDADFEGSLLGMYRILRTINPSPYMFYFASDDLEVAGASPETLVKLRDGVLHTFPLAGTRPRSADDAENARREADLLADEKELAEHNMLVDLGRNDLGKVSRFGSVVVEKYMELQRFSHVVHIGSTVRGEIVEGKTALDAIDAVLPAGTLSGAPKLRAMEIINELENNKRGIYGGAIGYIDFTGNMDTAIGIRLAYKKNGKVFVRSGAGIVLDSDPQREYLETVNKAKAVVEAIELSQEVH